MKNIKRLTLINDVKKRERETKSDTEIQARAIRETRRVRYSLRYFRICCRVMYARQGSQAYNVAVLFHHYSSYVRM